MSKQKIFATKTKIILAAAGFTAFTTMSILDGAKLSNIENTLMKNRNYRSYKTLDGYKNRIELATRHLIYTPEWDEIQSTPDGNTMVNHSADYPNPKIAKDYLRRITSENALVPIVNKTLDSISQTLPDENAIRSFKGEPVDNETFEAQRQVLSSCSKLFDKESQERLGAVPETMKAEKENAIWGLVKDIALALGALGAGIFSLMRDLAKANARRFGFVTPGEFLGEVFRKKEQ
ncbi:Uncharacterised protein [uncultured archaeon]|nr:Uncharacterised protein [uncultured archaeon]